MRHVHPDLVGAPGFQPAVQQRGGGRGAEPFEHAGAGDGAPPAGCQHRLLLPVVAVAADLRGHAQHAARFGGDPGQVPRSRALAASGTPCTSAR